MSECKRCRGKGYVILPVTKERRVCRDCDGRGIKRKLPSDYAYQQLLESEKRRSNACH